MQARSVESQSRSSVGTQKPLAGAPIVDTGVVLDLPRSPLEPAIETSHGSALVWQGFDYEWEKTPHRLSRLGSILETANLSLPDGRVNGLYISHFAVGDFKKAVDGAGVVAEIGHGRTRLARISGRGSQGSAFIAVDGHSSVLVSGPVGSARQRGGRPVFVPRPSSIGTGPLAATAILRGFDISCVSDDSGVATRGFGFHIRNLAVRDDGLSFTPEVYIHPDNPPGPLHQSADYVYLLTVHYTAILAAQDQIRITLDTPEAPPASAVYEGKGDEDPRLATSFHKGLGGGVFNQGVIGVRGFEWRLRNFGKTAKDGRYLRRLLCSVGDVPGLPRYDPQTGVANFQARFVFSNNGPNVLFTGGELTANGFVAEHELAATLIQFRSTAQAPTRDLDNVIKIHDTDEGADSFVL